MSLAPPPEAASAPSGSGEPAAPPPPKFARPFTVPFEPTSTYSVSPGFAGTNPNQPAPFCPSTVV